MELKNFLSEFEGLSDIREMTLEKIKKHNLPVIIYGAGGYASAMTDKLKSIGVEIHGYSVDADFYAPNKTFRGLPIYNFEEISKQADKYVFVLGMNGSRAFDFLKNDKIIHYAISYAAYQNITYAYILENKNEFLETYSLLENDDSKKTMVNYLKLHISGDPAIAEEFDYEDGNEDYFNKYTYSTINNRGGVCRLRSLARGYNSKVH